MLVNELKCVREELKQTRDDRDRLQLQVQTLAAKVEKYGESTAKSCAQLDTLTIKTNALEVSFLCCFVPSLWLFYPCSLQLFALGDL